MMLVRWRPFLRPAENFARWAMNSPSDNIVEQPYAEYRAYHTPYGGRDHVGDGRSDLDRQ